MSICVIWRHVYRLQRPCKYSTWTLFSRALSLVLVCNYLQFRNGLSFQRRHQTPSSQEAVLNDSETLQHVISAKYSITYEICRWIWAEIREKQKQKQWPRPHSEVFLLTCSCPALPAQVSEGAAAQAAGSGPVDKKQRTSPQHWARATVYPGSRGLQADPSPRWDRMSRIVEACWKYELAGSSLTSGISLEQLRILLWIIQLETIQVILFPGRCASSLQIFTQT